MRRKARRRQRTPGFVTSWGVDPVTLYRWGKRQEPRQPITDGPDAPTDYEAEQKLAGDDGVRYEPRWVEHHGQRHPLDQDEWEAKLDEIVDVQRAKDGGYKTVVSQQPKEEYL